MKRAGLALAVSILALLGLFWLTRGPSEERVDAGNRPVLRAVERSRPAHVRPLRYTVRSPDSLVLPALSDRTLKAGVAERVGDLEACYAESLDSYPDEEGVVSVVMTY